MLNCSKKFVQKITSASACLTHTQARKSHHRLRAQQHAAVEEKLILQESGELEAESERFVRPFFPLAHVVCDFHRFKCSQEWIWKKWVVVDVERMQFSFTSLSAHSHFPSRTAFSSSSPSCAFFNPFHYSFSFSCRSEEFFQHALKSRVACILLFQLEELDWLGWVYWCWRRWRWWRKKNEIEIAPNSHSSEEMSWWIACIFSHRCSRRRHFSRTGRKGLKMLEKQNQFCSTKIFYSRQCVIWAMNNERVSKKGELKKKGFLVEALRCCLTRHLKSLYVVVDFPRFADCCCWRCECTIKT